MVTKLTSSIQGSSLYFVMKKVQDLMLIKSSIK